MQQLIRVTPIQAQDIQPGDKLRYYYSGKFDGILTVQTVDIRDNLHDTWPDYINLQGEHATRGRIAAQYLGDSIVEKVERLTASFQTLQWVKSLRKLRVSKDALQRLRQPTDDTLTSRKARIKRKSKR